MSAPGPQFSRTFPRRRGAVDEVTASGLHLRNIPRIPGPVCSLVRQLLLGWGGAGPTMRRAAPLRHRGVRGPGNTPADAGSRPRCPRSSAGTGGHPRRYEEQAQSGKFRWSVPENTPTDAEGCRTRRCYGSSGGQHPRGCGEQTGPYRRNAELRGTSPRVRRADPGHFRDQGRAGNDAGRGPGRSPSSGPGREHPRACREQPWQVAYVLAPVGTSPLMQGAVQDDGTAGGGGGNIPAVAGSIAASSCTSWQAREHSRGCGKQHLAAGSLGVELANIPTGAGSR